MISIIVPVYNVEGYLPQCLDSILGQSFRDFELILVDDESTDGSADLCRRYAEADPRIVFLRQPNSGASAARNAGIRAAKGDYILFIDGDDYIESDSLARIVTALPDAGGYDIVFLKAISLFPDGSTEPNDVYDLQHYHQKNPEEVLAYLAAHDPLPVCVWGKLIRRSLITEHDIYFTEGIICEDVDYCIKLYMHAKTYYYVDTLYYYYRKNRVGSVMNINAAKKYYSLLSIIFRWMDAAETVYPQYAPYLHSILAFQYCMLLPMYRTLPKGERAAERARASAPSWLLGCAADKRVRLLHAVNRTLGFGSVVAALGLYDWLKRVGAKR